MTSSECLDGNGPATRLSLVVPLVWASTPGISELDDYRRLLAESYPQLTVETILVGPKELLARVSGGDEDDASPDGESVTLAVIGNSDDWSELAREGMWAATGDHFLVLDIERHYSPEALISVLEPVLGGQAELAVAIPTGGASLGMGIRPIRGALGLASRLVLGSSEVFSGLFSVARPLWEKGGRSLIASGQSLVLELLLRRPAACLDVPVAVGPRFRSQRFQFQDLRPLKHVLDGRYGSWSRLIQFCFVGASGMVVDLTFYALFQWVLSFTALYTPTSARPTFSWHLAVAGALSIAIALVWNFTLNRRLTFNDARGGSWIKQFLTYALSNALAIALSLTVRVYLPTRVAFFARHRLAAAVVGIVGATGISFSMSRWIVFTRNPSHPHLKPMPEQASMSSPSSVVV